ncbi:sigma-70 family RNA polymerase sigma factor [Actinopolymorpha sp. B17G11]|uniref:sigma-70 family RNA polymerase sigma factor n=1 Tax=Actinopolymorpha sp. B17G11 TaxID=3160861 RepID=UPI0032E40401
MVIAPGPSYVYNVMDMPSDDYDEGHIRSFTGAFPDLFPRAVRLARRILTDQASAEDVAAEALTRAYAAWDRINTSAGHRTAWVLRVTTNLAIDVVRRRANLERVTEASPFELETLGSSPRQVDEQDAATTRLVLIDAMRGLPRRQQEAITLRYLAGLSQVETAQALGVSTGTVARHVHRGLAGLRTHLAELQPAIAGITELVEGGRMKISSLQEAVELQGTDTVLEAHVTGVLPGEWGWSVDVGIPAVLVMRGRRQRPIGDDDLSALVGEDVDCVVAEVDLDRERMVVARVMSGVDEEEEYARRHRLVAGIRPGELRSGRVHSLVPFGAFVDIGGLHGLVHVSELGRSVDHPGEVLQVGQDVDVEVLDTNVELQRVALRLHQIASTQ